MLTQCQGRGKWDWAFRNHVILLQQERNKQCRGRQQQTEVCVDRWGDDNVPKQTYWSQTPLQIKSSLPHSAIFCHGGTMTSPTRKPLQMFLQRIQGDDKVVFFFANSGNHFPLASANQSSPGWRSVYVTACSPTGLSSAVPSHRLRVS